MGRGLLALAAVLILFVGYQLWGTGLAQSRAQDGLRHQFEQALAHHRSAPRAGPAAAAVPAAPAIGQPIGVLDIPAIAVDQVVVEGVGAAQLAAAPGHYPGTALPGQPGNAGIAGHRTTHGRPFYDLQALVPGDPITVTTVQGTFHYRVVRSQVVAPTDVAVLDRSPFPELTLTTCNPRYSAAQRLVVTARLVSPVAPATPTGGAPDSSAAAGPDPVRSVGDWLRLLGWLVLFAAVAALVWLLNWRRWGRARWVALVPAVAAGGVVLFFLFGAVNALLPESF